MMIRTFSAVAAALFTAGTLALSTPLRVADVHEKVEVEVAAADLDLTPATGIAALARHAQVALRRI